MRENENRNKRVSIHDVATRAGVSITTVSRVINNVDYPVSGEVRKRVLDAVSELNYTPNISAQHLRRSFNNVIALIVRDVANSYFGDIAKGVTEKAMELGYLSFICNTGRDPANELKYHDLLWQHRVRGIILAGGGIRSERHLEVLQRQVERGREFGFSIVSLAPQPISIRSVSVDYAQVAEMMTSYLLSKGHRSIGFITGRADVVTCGNHLEGYQRALAQAGVAFQENLFVYQDFTEPGGYHGFSTLLSRKLNVTALCAGSDTIGTGVLQAAHHKGVRVPRDLSLIGIGDLPQAQYMQPPLTTVRIPRYEMGARAVELIVGAQDNSKTDLENEVQDIVFQPLIVERSSVRDIGWS